MNKINSENKRSGIRALVKTNVPAHIKNPSYEIALVAMKTETHIGKLMLHPTGEFKNCSIYNMKVNGLKNSEILYEW